MSKYLMIFLAITFVFSNHIHSQRIVVNRNKFEVQGKQIFLNGINSPWQNDRYYRIDFLGTNHFNAKFWKDEFDKMSRNKVNFVRIWVHGRGNNTPAYDRNGYVLSPTSKFMNHLNTVLNYAKNKKIYVLLNLWSFDMVLKRGNGQPGSTQYVKNRNVIKDFNKLKSYVNNFLTPVVNAHKNNPYLLGYDIINEPEHMWENQNNLVDGKINRNETIRFVAFCAAKIHEISNNRNLTTVGSKWAIYNSSKYQGYGGIPHTGDNYTNWSLRNQYNNWRAYLDFYSMHWYQWQSTGAPFRESKWTLFPGVSKPVVITEFPGLDLPNNSCNCTCTSSNCNFNVKLKDVYNKVRALGYAGISAWRNGLEDDNFGKSWKIYEATRSFANNFPNLVFPLAGSQNKDINEDLITNSEETSFSVYQSSSIENSITLEVNLKDNSFLSTKLINSMGQTIYENLIAEINSGKNSIPLTFENMTSNGIYFLQVKTKNHNKTLRVIF